MEGERARDAAHQGEEVLCRDRGAVYSGRGTVKGVPTARLRWPCSFLRRGGDSQEPSSRGAGFGRRLGLVKQETQSFYETAVRRAVRRIVSGVDSALELEQLAREAALSPLYFHRVFRGMVGETPLQLHRRLRLERAAWTLLHETLPVTRIAFEAGYESHEAFTRVFRAHYGCSPSEFRAMGRSASGVCARSPQFELAAPSGIHFNQTHDLTVLQGETSMQVEIVDRPELRVATVIHRGPYHRISEAFARLGSLAGPAGLIRERPTMLAVYYDDPEITPEADLRSDAGLVVPNDAQLPEGLTETRLAAGRYARALHIGPYENLGDTWSRFMGQWLPQSGHRLGAGASYEIYHNTPADTPPDQLRTELYLPLAE